MKAITNLKIDGTYARPVLTAQERQNDRDLVKMLKKLRQDNPELELKIYRGTIYAKIEHYYVEYYKPELKKSQATD